MGILKKFELFIIKKISPRRTLSLQIDITNLCNLRCTHCYHPHHKNQGALSLEQWQGVLEQYSRLMDKIAYRKHVIICGGEPLTSPFLLPLMERAQQLGVKRVSILTNGTIVKKAVLNGLKNFDKYEVQISLDGSSSYSHDKVRGQASFNKTLAGIQEYKEAGIPVHLQTVLSVRSSSEIGDFFKLAAELQINSMNFTRFIPKGIGRGLLERGEDQPLGPLELKQAYQEIVRQSAESGVRSNIRGPLYALVHPSLGRSGRFDEGIVVDYQGRILASSRSRLVLGSALEEGLETVFFTHPLYKALRQGKIEECGSCPLLHSCGGDRNAAYALTGNYLGPDPSCWRKAI